MNFHTQEFHCPSDASLHLMYRCGLRDCDGAWGTSHEFSQHVTSKKHLQVLS